MTALTDRMDGLSGSVAIKAPCRVATTGPITLSGFQTIAGVVLAGGDVNLRVLVKDQADAVTNGIYDAQSGAWTRAKDFNGNRDALQGTCVVIADAAIWLYRLTTANPIIFNTSNIAFEAAAISDGEEVLYLHGGTDSVGRTVSAKLREFVTPQDFGAVADGVTDDSAAIQAAIDAVSVAGGIVHIPHGSYGVGTVITIPSDIGLHAEHGATFLGVGGATAGIDCATTDYFGRQTFPSLRNFTSYGLKLKGTDAANIHIPAITVCGVGIIFEVRAATHNALLDSTVTFDVISETDTGIMFDSDDEPNIIQGNEIRGNFITATTTMCLFFCQLAPGATGFGWDSNKVVIQATDNAGCADPTNARVLAATHMVPRLTFRVESWCGGMVGDATAKFISGLFNEGDIYLSMAQNVGVGQMNLGNSLITQINLRRQLHAGDLAVAASATANNLAGFNGGVPLYNNWHRITGTLGADLLDGVNKVFYIYHSLALLGDNNIMVLPSSEGVLPAPCTRIVSNHPSPLYEIAINFYNSTGATIPNGTVFYFAVRVGLW